jgi:hypothetical protein
MDLNKADAARQALENALPQQFPFAEPADEGHCP